MTEQLPDGRDPAPDHGRHAPAPLATPRALTVVLLVALLVGGAAYAVGQSGVSAGSRSAPTTGAAVRSPASLVLPSSASPQAPGATETPNPLPSRVSQSSPEHALADLIGQKAGEALAGHAPQSVPRSQIGSLGNQVPAGASVQGKANRLLLPGEAASVTIEAVPPANPDMTFRIAGMVNPTIEVHHGATLTVRFINADTDQAHGWQVTNQAPPYSFGPPPATAFPGARADVIGNPWAGSDGARTITFRVGVPGTYHYLCPMPGHAQMGMQGLFIVT